MIRDAIIINVILLSLYFAFVGASMSSNPALRGPANEVRETLVLVEHTMRNGITYVSRQFEEHTQ
jgi:hypothetical protein